MSEEVEMTPISPEEGGNLPPKVSPFGAVPTPSPAPAPASNAAASPTAGVSTIKLKPVIRKPMIHKPTIGGAKPAMPTLASAAAPTAAEAPAAPKKATQNLKSVTGPIPAQATLRKTGIIAEGILTPAQQQAAKSKTSRISLESAIGVAPAKEGPAPLKTIRLRRPTDLKPPTASAEPAHPAPAPLPAAAPAEGAEASETQKKTLKLHRPGIGIKKPTLGLQKKEEPAPAQQSADVQDIPDLPAGDVAPLMPVSDKEQCAGVPKWVATLSFIVTFAALLAVGALVYFFYLEGCGPDAGANAMPFITTGA